MDGSAPAARTATITHNGTCTNRCSVFEDIRIAREAGFDAIEIIGPKLDNAIRLGYTTDLVRRELDGFPVVAVSFIPDIDRQEAADFKALMAEATIRFDQAKALGAGCVEVVVGPVGPGLGGIGGYAGLVGRPIDEVIELTAKNLRALADLAGESGLKLYLEPLAWAPLSRLDDLLKTVEATGRENVGLVIDFWHLWVIGTPAAAVARLDPGKIFGVHFCDSLPPPPAGQPILHNLREVWTGGGHVPLQEWVDAIVSTGYSGWWSTEMFAPQFSERNPLKVARLLQETLRLLVEAAVPFGTRPVPGTGTGQ
jgi:sugar phosphate isomerase/epimerase